MWTNEQQSSDRGNGTRTSSEYNIFDSNAVNEEVITIGHIERQQ